MEDLRRRRPLPRPLGHGPRAPSLVADAQRAQSFDIANMIEGCAPTKRDVWRTYAARPDGRPTSALAQRSRAANAFLTDFKRQSRRNPPFKRIERISENLNSVGWLARRHRLKQCRHAMANCHAIESGIRHRLPLGERKCRIHAVEQRRQQIAVTDDGGERRAIAADLRERGEAARLRLAQGLAAGRAVIEVGE